MQIKSVGQPLANIPVPAGTGATPAGGTMRPLESGGHELPALVRRTPSTALGVRQPERTTLSKLLTATPHSCADSAATHPEATRAMSRVVSGEVVLRNRHAPANLRAATTVAASGMAMLRTLLADA